MSVRTHPDGWVSAQGNYAGSVSRLVAYLIDLLVSTVIFQLALASISFVWSVFTGHGITWHRDSWVVIVTYVLWQFVYFGFQWAANGKSLGMTLLGVHIVKADGLIGAVCFSDRWRLSLGRGGRGRRACRGGRA